MGTSGLDIRRSIRKDASKLPDIERSAGIAFLSFPALAWIADDTVISIQEHERFCELGTSWVAEIDDGVIGFIVAEVFDRDFHVLELAVAFEAQGRGIGRAMMTFAKGEAARQGCSRLTLSTFTEVPWNEPFYRSLGFEILPPEEWGARLSALMAEEALAGLERDRRCVMTLGC